MYIFTFKDKTLLREKNVTCGQNCLRTKKNTCKARNPCHLQVLKCVA